MGPGLKVVKSLSDTTWSARCDAVSALCGCYNKILSVLLSISEDNTLKDEYQVEASSLLKNLKKFNNVFLLVVWNNILSKIHATNLTIQKANTDLGVVVNLFDALEKYVAGLREKFSEFVDEAKKLANIEEIPNDESCRTRKRSVRLTRFEGPSNDTSFSQIDSLKIEVFFATINSLVMNLKQRKEAYAKLHENFSFIRKLQALSDDEIKINCLLLFFYF